MASPDPPTVSVYREGDVAVVTLTGTWTLADGLPSAAPVAAAVRASPRARMVRVLAVEVDAWATSLVVFLARVHDLCAEERVELDTAYVPEGARRLLVLARQGTPHPPEPDTGESRPHLGLSVARWAGAWWRSMGARAFRPGQAIEPRPDPLSTVVGHWALEWARALGGQLDFIGSAAVSLVRTLAGWTRPLPRRFLLLLQQAGVETLPIVALMAFAMGAVLALIASGQLQRFAATPLVARIVSIAVLREMGALMVGIAIAGRLGSAIAAELATMTARREIDVMRLVGIDPFDYLVTPRVLALAVAGPLLVIYANVMGLLGGMFVGVAIVGLPAQEYVERMLDVLTYRHGFSGLLKGLAFGVATAMVACYYGLRAAREHAQAVGEVVRRAVVAAVVGVVLWDAAITLFFKWVRF